MEDYITNSQGITRLRNKKSSVTLKTLKNIKNKISKGKTAQKYLGILVEYNWTEKLSLQTTDQNYLEKLIKKSRRVENIINLTSLRIFETIQVDISLSQPSISIALSDTRITRKRLIIIVELKNAASSISQRTNFTIC
ncbi:hypothetical protein MXB_5087 [Myxobolus squamalis]|nr:hypothetical protein MXB_5087 [Myxobolus squamalis]